MSHRFRPSLPPSGFKGTNFRYGSTICKAYLDSELTKPSDRRIIEIVKNSMPPDTFNTPPRLAKEYHSINPAINEYSVHFNTSGRDSRRVQKTVKIKRLKEEKKVPRSSVRDPLHVKVEHGPEDYETTVIDLTKEPMYWTLPGHGKKGREDCGKRKWAEACQETEDSRPRVLRNVKWKCNRATCPDDFEGWTDKTARETMMKLRGARHLFGLRGKDYTLCHVMISAPPEYSKYLGKRYSWLKLKEDFLRVTDAFDLHGVFIFHPWRGKKDALSDETLDVDLSEAIPSDYWREGPHVHAVAFCCPDVIKMASESFYKQTGFVIKVIAEDMKDDYAQNVISYALSHAGIGHSDHFENTHAITYFGKLATSKKGGISELATIKEAVKNECSECGSRLYKTRDLDNGLDDLSEASGIVLKHKLYVRREEKHLHDLFTLGMSDRELLEYALQNTGDVAYITDDRGTEVQANCKVSDLLEAERNGSLRWRPSFKFGDKGQTEIDNLVFVNGPGSPPEGSP